MLSLAFSPLLLAALTSASPIWLRTVQPRQEAPQQPAVPVISNTSSNLPNPETIPSGSYFAFGSLPNSFRTNLSEIIVFGDSLSDNGNGSYKLSGGTTPPPKGYPAGTWSNGPVYTSYMASRLGLNSKLTDYAVGGATTFDTGRGPNLTNAETGEQVVIPSTLTQLETYVSNGTVSANALYIILTGGNDFLGGYNVSGEMSAMAVQGGVDRLIGGGAEHILLINLFDIAIPATQAAADNSTSEESPLGSVATQFTTELSVAYNQIFSAANYTNVVAISDLFTASKVIAVSADQFGFDPERLTEPCLQSTIDESTGVTNYTICDNPNGAFFWDEVHPTTRGHSLLASLNIATLLRKGWAQNAF